MAITKTNLYHVETESCFLNLYNYLLENAVPTYFDSIVKQEDNSYMSCFVGDFEFIRINQNAASGGIIIYNTSGENITAKYSTSDTKYYRFAYKCSSGIMIAVKSDTSLCFTIAKDNNGDTVIITTTGLYINDSTTTANQVYSVNKSSPKKSARFHAVGSDSATALCPIVVSSAKLTYVQGGYLLVYSESNTAGALELNGEQYLTNGLWCLKD